MNNYLDIAKKYHSAGLRVIPVREDKRPDCGAWKSGAWKQYLELQTEEDIKNLFDRTVYGIALLCGNGVEAIDIDQKYDLVGKLFIRYKDHVEYSLGQGNLFDRLLIQKTQNSGYHLIYGFDSVDGNVKLARRATIETERKNENDKVRVLFETRGYGGYVVVYPTPGYELLNLDFESIDRVTAQERKMLFQGAKAFNDYEPDVVDYRPDRGNESGQWSWEQYNDSQDVLDELESSGWSRVSKKGEFVYMNRPGAKHQNRVDASFNTLTNYFWVYSTSTVFTEEKGYSPTAVYATLHCNGNMKEAAKQLHKKGYGNVKTSEPIEIAKKLKEGNKLIEFVESTKFDVTKKIERETACLKFVDFHRRMDVAGLGMVGAVVGPQKAGKTLITTAICGSALTGGIPKMRFSLDVGDREILFFDTEQSKYFYSLTQKRIYDIAGMTVNHPDYSAYHLRRLVVEERKKAIEHFLYESKNPGLVVIDGVVDLITDYNDLRESQALISTILKWSDETKAMIILVLHTTKSAGYMRGHIGTELQNKCDFAIGISKNKSTGVFTVESRESRFAPFPDYEFIRDENGTPIIEGVPAFSDNGYDDESETPF